MVVTLQPIAMVRPNAAGVYAPSRLRPARDISECEFLRRYADYARVVLVSFQPDGVSSPETVTAYGQGLDCWYIVVAHGGTSCSNSTPDKKNGKRGLAKTSSLSVSLLGKDSLPQFGATVNTQKGVNLGVGGSSNLKVFPFWCGWAVFQESSFCGGLAGVWGGSGHCFDIVWAGLGIVGYYYMLCRKFVLTTKYLDLNHEI